MRRTVELMQMDALTFYSLYSVNNKWCKFCGLLLYRVGFFVALGMHNSSNHPAHHVRKIVYAVNHTNYISSTNDKDVAVVCWKDPVEFSDKIAVQ